MNPLADAGIAGTTRLKAERKGKWATGIVREE
jgi:hypothetical protein